MSAFLNSILGSSYENNDTILHRRAIQNAIHQHQIIQTGARPDQAAAGQLQAEHRQALRAAEQAEEIARQDREFERVEEAWLAAAQEEIDLADLPQSTIVDWYIMEGVDAGRTPRKRDIPPAGQVPDGSPITLHPDEFRLRIPNKDSLDFMPVFRLTPIPIVVEPLLDTPVVPRPVVSNPLMTCLERSNHQLTRQEGYLQSLNSRVDDCPK
ncbi:hypothetical protein BJX66DRAFT_296627 [Aspergillus keveii]|uniref:Uncharacterized protein n=1 Tax=Aspergillus keveii TaxID=714993 RepID=A0ABR4GFN4_9EURO